MIQRTQLLTRYFKKNSRCMSVLYGSRNLQHPDLKHNKHRVQSSGYFQLMPFSTSAKNTAYFKQFHQLDDISPDTAQFLIESMKVMLKFPCIAGIKQSSINNMLDLMFKNSLSKFPQILEIGCGHGIDAKSIAEKLDYGQVIAADSSQRMINEALRLCAHSKVKYLCADDRQMFNLGYARYFDACHADRLLVSSSDYKQLFQNILLLVKPSGVLSITDVDASSIIIEPASRTTQIILTQLKQNFINKSMGSELNNLFSENQLQNITVESFQSTVTSFNDLCKIFQFDEIVKTLVERQTLTTNEGKQWFNDMYQAESTGNFKYTVMFHTVQGTLPADTIDKVI